MDVLRTFAESEARSRHSMPSRRGVHTSPAGRIHAAEQLATTTLCGRPTRNLFEFGRSRYPFELTPTSARCPTCNLLAGTPTRTEARPDILGHPASGGRIEMPVEGHAQSIGRHALSADPDSDGRIVMPVEGHAPSIGRHALAAEYPEFPGSEFPARGVHRR